METVNGWFAVLVWYDYFRPTRRETHVWSAYCCSGSFCGGMLSLFAQARPNLPGCLNAPYEREGTARRERTGGRKQTEHTKRSLRIPKSPTHVLPCTYMYCWLISMHVVSCVLNRPHGVPALNKCYVYFILFLNKINSKRQL